jgi:hypothetical protein
MPGCNQGAAANGSALGSSRAFDKRLSAKALCRPFCLAVGAAVMMPVNHVLFALLLHLKALIPASLLLAVH